MDRIPVTAASLPTYTLFKDPMAESITVLISVVVQGK
jgi:hypothetical protein